MGNIDHLTVLSNDGASDVVKNVTRTVTEAERDREGPDRHRHPGAAQPGRGQRREQPTSASGGDQAAPQAERAGGGGARPSGGTRRPAGPHRRRARDRPHRTRRRRGRLRASGPTRPRRPARRDAGHGTDVGRAPPPPRFEHAGGRRRGDRPTPTRAVRARRGDVPRRDRHRRRPRPPAPRPASADITRETTVDDAATRLAADLRAVPGIERFAAVRLGELDRSGPRPLRTMWRIAREQLDERYGQMTIGELIERYGSGPSA